MREDQCIVELTIRVGYVGGVLASKNGFRGDGQDVWGP